MRYHCSLQINLAPNDYPHAVYILPHQLKTLSGQVDRIVLIIDTHRSKGRFGENWEGNLTLIKGLVNRLALEYNNISIIEVDYSKPVSKTIAESFFNAGYIPKKDYRGGPFYAYFFGLYSCDSDYVLHLDSDMLLGGMSQSWVQEAIDQLYQDDSLIICSPLPGPPHPEGILIGQPGATAVGDRYKFQFSQMSTRIFLLKMKTFEKNKITLKRPPFDKLMRAFLKGNPAFSLPEVLISDFMIINHLKRIDFLGSGMGLWSLHPPFRTLSFYKNLPSIINDVEHNTLPSKQNGFYDLVDEVCDWTEAREKLKANRWWKRLLNGRSR